MPTYSWTFTALDCYPEQEGHLDVVCQVWYTYTATEGGVSGSVQGKNAVSPHVAEEPFVPFHELTPAVIQGWIEMGMGPEALANLRQAADRALAEVASPTMVRSAPPWILD